MCKHYFLIINFCLYLCLILMGCSKTDNSSSNSNSSNTKTCDTYKSENYTCFEKLDPKGLPEYYLIPLQMILLLLSQMRRMLSGLQTFLREIQDSIQTNYD